MNSLCTFFHICWLSRESISKSTIDSPVVDPLVRYLGFRNVSRSYVSGTFLPYYTATSRTSNKNIFTELTLKILTNPDTWLAVERLHTHSSATCAISCIIVVSLSATAYGLLLSVVASLPSLRPNFPTSSFFRITAVSRTFSSSRLPFT